MGEEKYSREILFCQGVPELAVHIFAGPIVNTEKEREIRDAEIELGLQIYLLGDVQIDNEPQDDKSSPIPRKKLQIGFSLMA